MTQSKHLPKGVGWGEGQRSPTFEEHQAEAWGLMDDLLDKPPTRWFSADTIRSRLFLIGLVWACFILFVLLAQHWSVK